MGPKSTYREHAAPDLAMGSQLRTVALVLLLMSVNPAIAASAGDDAIARTVEAYAALRSYSDVGVVLTHFIANEDPTETKFETAFARPALFRFSWISHHPFQPLRKIEWRSTIWADGVGVFSRFGFSEPVKTETQRSLISAIASATGVSGGSAYTVPSMLMPELGASYAIRLTSVTLVGPDTFEGAACAHIAATNRRGDPVDLWIGAEDHLIRKVQMRLGGVLVEEIHRDIHTNQPIPLSTFSPKVE